MIRKRDGRLAAFNESKITDAIFKAAQAAGGHDRTVAMELTIDVLKELRQKFHAEMFNVEDIQDVVEKVLIEKGHAKTAKAYILHRAYRSRIRDGKSELMDAVEEILVETNRENANISNSPSAKMLQIASAASKKFYLSRMIPEDQAQAHIRGDIHIHDLDFYGKTLTCVQIPLARMLRDGFNNGHGYIRPPKRPTSATALAAIVLQSSQNDMHGGQAFSKFDIDMAEFMKSATDNEVFQAMEALIYNLNSMHSRAGAQVPFSSLNLGTDTSPEGRAVIKNLLLAYEKGLGRGENPIFPNIIFKVKEGINLNPEDPNYDLFKLAIRVAAKRLNPTFAFLDSSFNSPYGTEVSYMGCRTRVIGNVNGPEIVDGRGNLSFTTINLPRVAIESEKNIIEFYRNLDDLLELVVQQLHHRYEVQANLMVKDMPFLMGQGVWMDSLGLKPNDSIREVIKHGTLSVGFIGLAETLTALVGKHHGESEDAQVLGIQIIEHMRKRMDEAVDKYGLNYSLLATPAEGLSGRFVRLDRKEYGVLPGITDKQYYTNSFHVPVGYEIGLFDKVAIEGPYHKFCNAGHISYVEFPSPPIHNTEAIESVLRHMKNTDIGYAGINFPVDYCVGCGYTGVINQDECPMCGVPDIKRVRRVTGYLGTVDRLNDAKSAEERDRVAHRLMGRE
jgi:ribonucleoside-triphosphate reductase